MKLYVNWLFLENVFLADEQTDQHFFIQRLLKTPQEHVELVVDFDMEAAYLDPQKMPSSARLRNVCPASMPRF